MSDRKYKIEQIEQYLFHLQKSGGTPEQITYAYERFAELKKPSIGYRDRVTGRYISAPPWKHPNFDIFSGTKAIRKRWANHQYNMQPKKIHERAKKRKERLIILRTAFEKAKQEIHATATPTPKPASRRPPSPWGNIR